MWFTNELLFILKDVPKKKKKIVAKIFGVWEWLKMLENDLDNGDNLRKYDLWDIVYEHIAKGIRIRSKYHWYEEGEMSPKLF